MKNRTITVRLTEEEYEKLNAVIQSAELRISEYIRRLLNKETSQRQTCNQHSIEKVCQLYVTLSELGLDMNERLMKEMNELCQTLS